MPRLGRANNKRRTDSTEIFAAVATLVISALLVFSLSRTGLVVLTGGENALAADTAGGGFADGLPFRTGGAIIGTASSDKATLVAGIGFLLGDVEPPVAGAVVQSKGLLGWEISVPWADNEGLASAEISFDGGAAEQVKSLTGTLATVKFTYNKQVVAGQVVRWVVSATDLAGNVGKQQGAFTSTGEAAEEEQEAKLEKCVVTKSGNQHVIVIGDNDVECEMSIEDMLMELNMTFPEGVDHIIINIHNPKKGEEYVDGPVYGYYNMTYVYANGTAPAQQSASGSVGFTIPNSWFTTTGAEEGQMVVYKYINGQWVAVPTLSSPGANDTTHYTATMDGMASGTILALAESPQSCPACQPAADWSACTDGEQTRVVYSCSASTNFACAAETERRPCAVTSPTDWTLWLLLIIVIVGTVAIYYWRKSRKTPAVVPATTGAPRKRVRA